MTYLLCSIPSYIPAANFCANHSHCSYETDPKKIGGADRDRTDDPLLAKQVLSQLSYSPGSND